MQKPLAIRLRPTKLDEVFGQQHLIGENMLLRRCVEQSSLFSIILTMYSLRIQSGAGTAPAVPPAYQRSVPAWKNRKTG